MDVLTNQPSLLVYIPKSVGPHSVGQDVSCMPLDCAIGRMRIKSLVSVAEGSHYSPELFRMLTGKTPDTGHPKYEKYLLHRITKTVGLEIISVN